MVTFIGKYLSKVDDKGRMVLPSAFRSALPAEADQRFVIKKSLYDDCLDMYTFEEWTRQGEKIKETLDFFNPDHVAFWREYMRGCDIVEPDPKLGRISISGDLLNAVGIDREVVFFGVDFKIEIWPKEGFDRSAISNDRFTSIAKSLSRIK